MLLLLSAARLYCMKTPAVITALLSYRVRKYKLICVDGGGLAGCIDRAQKKKAQWMRGGDESFQKLPRLSSAALNAADNVWEGRACQCFTLNAHNTHRRLE